MALYIKAFNTTEVQQCKLEKHPYNITSERLWKNIKKFKEGRYFKIATYFLTHLKAIADLSNVPRFPGSCSE